MKKRNGGSNMPDERIAFESGSGNVFEDLALPDAALRLVKADLALLIRDLIESRDWNQTRAARELGIAQPDVSDLFRGKLNRFSQERLELFLNALGMDISIRVAPKAPGKPRADMRVELVAAL